MKPFVDDDDNTGKTKKSAGNMMLIDEPFMDNNSSIQNFSNVVSIVTT